MTTKHTHQVVFGRKVEGCPRCDELKAGFAPIKWQLRSVADEADQRRQQIRTHFAQPNHGKPGDSCYPVCTAFEW